MRAETFRFIATLAGLVILSAPAFSQEKVGEVTSAKTRVTGAGGTLRVKSPVHRDERIRTSQTGLGEFLFRDGTRFAVGSNSSVVIDDFVFNDTKSAKKVTVKAAKGTFRWISGQSKSSAYSIATPAGTLGIRGTAFDFYVAPDGTTAVVLLEGAARFCGRNGCRDLRRRCDYIIATPRGGVTDPKRVNRNVLNALGNSGALPFQSGNQRLSRKFYVGPSCLSIAAIPDPRRLAPQRAAPPDPLDPAPPPPPPAQRGNNGHGNDPDGVDGSNPKTAGDPSEGDGPAPGGGNRSRGRN